MKMKLFTYIEEYSGYELLSPLDAPKKPPLAEFRKDLEGGSIVNWPYELWDGVSKCIIKTKLEPFNMQGNNVYVIPIPDGQ